MDEHYSERALERRTEIIDATMRVIERKGLEGASMRGIARELGLTTGLVTHYFKDKNEILTTAIDALFKPFEVRLGKALETSDITQGLIEVLITTLPTQEPQRAAQRLFAHVLLQIKEDPVVGNAYRDRFHLLNQGICKLIKRGQDAGVLRNDFDPQRRTDFLCAFADGLGLHATGGLHNFSNELMVSLMMEEINRMHA
ncbi:TetR/AcrR family transcriptional regulator [Pseudomonas typographi]|uniref:TetR/AcrR family transcriptional regulator n=1 Tax=Pseudomonas typographi TaxID=2715964 RepID=UPI001686CD15|nr:TetR/AcrR family transcriptional regulator [Pseudomonas typographi]MBD1588845.1 TetR family transcriptional regulator [Pseudomonas typographi]